MSIQEQEVREILDQLPRWEVVKFIWYARFLRLRQRALAWLHRSRLALDLTYRQIERERQESQRLLAFKEW